MEIGRKTCWGGAGRLEGKSRVEDTGDGEVSRMGWKGEGGDCKGIGNEKSESGRGKGTIRVWRDMEREVWAEDGGEHSK